MADIGYIEQNDRDFLPARCVRSFGMKVGTKDAWVWCKTR